MSHQFNLTTMSKKNNLVFTILSVVAWVIFVGLCIEAGGLITNLIFSIYKPELVQNLYENLDLSQMYNLSKGAYFGMYAFILAIAILKAHLFYEVIRLVSKINLAKPFSQFVSKQILQISYYTFSIGLISLIGRQTAKNLQHYGFETESLNPYWADSQAFILMGVVIYVIAQIFKRGLEIQAENELTI